MRVNAILLDAGQNVFRAGKYIECKVAALAGPVLGAGHQADGLPCFNPRKRHMASTRFIPLAAALLVAGTLTACSSGPGMRMGMGMGGPGQSTMARMDMQMGSMRQVHEKMMAAKTPEERQRLAAEHMKSMREGMQMMERARDMPADPEARHQMMEKRMEMMQTMMKMMMDQMPAVPSAPAK